MVVVAVEFGVKKAKTGSELVEHYVRNSDMFLQVHLGERGSHPESIWIELYGEIAHIPSLKNSKPKFGGIDKKTLARLKAMDIHFQLQLKAHGIPAERINFGSSQVFVQLITASSYRRANEDNSLTTIKDWLEPHSKIVGSKNKRARGWGIGLIGDDIQARGFALKAEDLEIHRDHSLVIVRPWESIREKAIDFVSATHI